MCNCNPNKIISDKLQDMFDKLGLTSEDLLTLAGERAAREDAASALASEVPEDAPDAAFDQALNLIKSLTAGHQDNPEVRLVRITTAPDGSFQTDTGEPVPEFVQDALNKALGKIQAKERAPVNLGRLLYDAFSNGESSSGDWTQVDLPGLEEVQARDANELEEAEKAADYYRDVVSIDRSELLSTIYRELRQVLADPHFKSLGARDRQNILASLLDVI